MSSSSHKFQEKTFTKLTYCDYCTKLLWGVAKQGVTCEGCHFNCHKKCSDLVYDNCVRSMYIPTPDELKRSSSIGGSGTAKTKGRPRRVSSISESMRVSIPPAIVSSSQPLQSLVEKPRRKNSGSEQDTKTEKSASPEAGRTSFLEDAIIKAAIRMSLQGDISALPKNHHPPLTIQATTINFTRFVHKTTAVFWFQDKIEDIMTWKDPWNTTFVLVLYCFVCIYPMLLFLLPQAIMATIMIYFLQQKSIRQQQKILGIKNPPKITNPNPSSKQRSPEEEYILAQEKLHHNRYHVYHDEDYFENPSGSSSDDEEERRSTGVQYLSNMQHIQNMMGDISQAHDVIKPLFKHLDWSDEAEATMIVQGTMAAFVGMSLVMWLVPWRLVFMMGGAGGMLTNSPWGKVAVKELGPLGMDIVAWAKVQAEAYKQDRTQDL
ncbi:integral peroxisomal membrane peroxin-domain-containing protein [Dissophora ornata]|nr:hypothetical protein BGZ58_001355 [Dissophora ornata]KAI8599871.1 integral peroxisomal membrane peroxin-domain-containing protein [Dissophora ornata]